MSSIDSQTSRDDAERRVTPTDTASSRLSRWTSDLAVLIYLAAATVLVHLVTGQQYGFHRDELATLDDARHMAWGFVAYPPITPLFGRLSLMLFGTSLTGFRFFAAVAQAAALVLTGLMAREMGGRRGDSVLPGWRSADAICFVRLLALGAGRLLCNSTAED